MYSIRRVFRMRNWRQRVTAVWLLITIIAAPIPFIPISRSTGQGKDLSRPFPCQDRPCGCRSADQCRKRCCCFSHDQKLAWARKHGLKAEDVIIAERPTAGETPAKKCCSTKSAGLTAHCAAAQTKSKPSKSSRFVLIVKAMECQGIEQTLFAQISFVTPPVIAPIGLMQPTGERIDTEITLYSPSVSEPPVPPPRISFV